MTRSEGGLTQADDDGLILSPDSRDAAFHPWIEVAKTTTPIEGVTTPYRTRQ